MSLVTAAAPTPLSLFDPSVNINQALGLFGPIELKVD